MKAKVKRIAENCVSMGIKNNELHPDGKGRSWFLMDDLEAEDIGGAILDLVYKMPSEQEIIDLLPEV